VSCAIVSQKQCRAWRIGLHCDRAIAPLREIRHGAVDAIHDKNIGNSHPISKLPATMSTHAKNKMAYLQPTQTVLAGREL
jgi:hypothetical protein